MAPSSLVVAKLASSGFQFAGIIEERGLELIGLLEGAVVRL